MTQQALTTAFLQQLSPKLKNTVLKNIASHYSITINEAYSEVTHEDAEGLMEYITGPERAAISLFYKQFCLKHIS